MPVKDPNRDLMKLVDELLKNTEGYGRLVQLFSKDPRVKQLAKARELASKIRFQLTLSRLKTVGFPEGRPVKPLGRPCLVRVRPFDSDSSIFYF